MSNVNNIIDNTISIATRATLVSLSLRQWGANKRDKKATAETCNNKAATQGAARVNKSLFPNSARFTKIKEYFNSVYYYHLRMTYDWDTTSNRRLLPVERLNDYMTAMADFKAGLEPLLDDFITNYNWEKSEAAVELGYLFDPEDYPLASELYERYEIKASYEPVPTSGDFRLEIPQAAIEELEREMLSAQMDRYKDSVSGIIKETRSILENLMRMMTSDKVTVRSTTIEKLLTQAERVKGLNLLGDEDVDKLSTAIAVFCKRYGGATDSIRNDATVLKEAVKDTTNTMAILDEIASMF